MKLLGILWARVIVATVLAVGVAGPVAAAPSIVTTHVTTFSGVPAAFSLVAEDPAIDPNDPSGHSIRFVVLAGPSHGVLSGDLAAVTYAPPHRAVVELTYIPAAGYVGGDRVAFVAVDPFGNASDEASIEVTVVERRAVGILSGTWDAEWTLNVQSAALTAFTQTVTESYRVGGLSVKSVARFVMDFDAGIPDVEFDALRFEAEGEVGEVRARAVLAFDPQAPLVADLFDYLQTEIRAELLGASLVHGLFLTRPLTDSYQTLALSAAVGDLELDDVLRFDLAPDCGFEFSRNEISVAWNGCEALVTAGVVFTGDGFERLTLRAAEVEVPQLAWLGAVTLDFGLSFEPDEKSMTLDVEWRPVPWGCFAVLGEIETGPALGAISAPSIYGIVLECEVGPVRVRSATSLLPEMNGVVTGQVDYFESLVLSGDLASCCGVPGLWTVATYFREGSAQLFDWGMFLLKADVGISEHLSIRFETALRSGELGDPTAEFTIGWTARW